jgi:hypothetical protein
MAENIDPVVKKRSHAVEPQKSTQKSPQKSPPSCPQVAADVAPTADGTCVRKRGRSFWALKTTVAQFNVD